MVFEDGLPPAVATMEEDSILTTDFPSYVPDGLFYSFDEETISNDVDIQNYNNIG